MRKRTQRKPLIFEIEGSKFRSTALGFLEANEVMLKYLPTIISLVEDFNTGKEEQEVATTDISKMFSSLDEKLITNVCEDLLYQTEFFDEDEEQFSVLDPNDFDNVSECLQVIWQVFQFNFPDFFGKGEDTAQELPTPKKTTKKVKAKKSLLQKAKDETS